MQSLERLPDLRYSGLCAKIASRPPMPNTPDHDEDGGFALRAPIEHLRRQVHGAHRSQAALPRGAWSTMGTMWGGVVYAWYQAAERRFVD